MQKTTMVRVLDNTGAYCWFERKKIISRTRADVSITKMEMTLCPRLGATIYLEFGDERGLQVSPHLCKLSDLRHLWRHRILQVWAIWAWFFVWLCWDFWFCWLCFYFGVVSFFYYYYFLRTLCSLLFMILNKKIHPFYWSLSLVWKTNLCRNTSSALL